MAVAVCEVQRTVWYFQLKNSPILRLSSERFPDTFAQRGASRRFFFYLDLLLS
jgi:hypothetical protein